ncbi:unannotated protein [freshwater metagenome]|uniref:Unannotated protein n=1 Tax=freshwater metagenome TaxID=449393 RepID=A0A6J6PPY3_9ZZZZ
MGHREGVNDIEGQSGARFERDVTLGDTTVMHIRPVRPTDRGELKELHDHGLSDTSAYYRFFGLRPHFPHEFLDNMTRFDPEHRVTLVGILGDAIVAAGTYNRESVDDVEVAFAVADRYQGLGIGTLLLEDLAVLARAMGFTRLVAHALPGNRPMLSVFANVGLVVRTRLDAGIVDIEMDLHDDVEFARRSDEREWAAQAASMRPYLAPRSVVVIGAGREPSSPGHRIAANVRRAFTGDLAVVRPDGASIAGVSGYRTVSEVPFAIDLAVIAVPAAVAPLVLDECGQAGVHAVVVITAGFSEQGVTTGTTDADLVAIAHRSGMRLLGPNCFGIIAPAVGLDATFSAIPPTVGGIAFGSQSGGIGLAVLAEATERGIGLSSFISLGNRADVSSNDLLCAWVDDPAAAVIMLYLESIGNPRRFLRIARHVASRKPVIVLKAGRSTSGRRGAASHTASLASDDAAVDALLRAAGVIRVDTLEEMLDVAQILAHQPAPLGPRVALIGNSGGPLILAADAAEAVGLQVPPLSEALRARILERVPRAAATSNPVDLLATVGPADVADVVGIVASSGEVDAVVVASVGVWPNEDTNLDDALGGNGVPGGMPTATPRGLPVVVSIAGIPARLSRRAVFRYSESAVRALGRAHAWSAWRAEHAQDRVPPIEAGSGSIDWLAVRRLVRAEAQGDQGTDGWLGPEAAQRIMRATGVRLAASGLAASPAEAAALASSLVPASGAVVMKAVVPGLLHKTEAGAVVLGVSGADAAAAAYGVFSERFPTMTAVLVQEQVAPGVELLVGARQDPSAGPLVVVAAGGVEAELLADIMIRAAPLTVGEARAMLLSLRTAARLTGFRGRPAVDLEQVARIVAQVSRLVAVVPELAEFEINPLVASTSGACAVDVRMRAEINSSTVRPLRGN